MQLEVGTIVEGKITGITNFGAFVALPEGKTGMVHISEISNSYVKDINDFLSENEDVTVKVLSVADDGKIGLSIKRLDEEHQVERKNAPREEAPAPQRQQRPRQPRRQNSEPDTWKPKAAASNDDMSFEDMLNRFKQVSNDRMGDLKRSQDNHRSRKGYGNNSNR